MDDPPDHDEDADGPNPHTATLVIAGASICELISASLVCNVYCHGLVSYAVAVGAVSLAFIIPVALVLFAEPLAPPQLHEGVPHLTLFLLVWWLPASFLLTFISPFQGLSNGYFATIAGVFGAVQLCRAYVAPIDTVMQQLVGFARESQEDRPVLCALALTSTAVWISAAVSMGGYPNEHMGIKAWAVIVGVVSMVLCIFYLLLDELSLHKSGFATLLACWWLQGIAISFVPSQFISTCNGFAATWASAFLAFHFLRKNRDPRDLLPVPSAPPDEDGLGLPTTTYISAGDVHLDTSEGFSSQGLGGRGTWEKSGEGGGPAAAGAGTADGNYTLGAPPVMPAPPPPGRGRLGPESDTGFRHTEG